LFKNLINIRILINLFYKTFRISNRHSRLVEDTTALEKMYVEGTLAKLLGNFGRWRAVDYFKKYFKHSDTEFEGAYCLIKTQDSVTFFTN
jgi:hypothetical protein